MEISNAKTDRHLSATSENVMFNNKKYDNFRLPDGSKTSRDTVQMQLEI